MEACFLLNQPSIGGEHDKVVSSGEVVGGWPTIAA